MFGSSFRVARIFGIDIEIHPSWLLILALLSWTLSDQAFPDLYEGWTTAQYWIIGTSAAVLLFVTVLIHELAHAVVAIRRGLAVPKITLFIFGGVSQLSRQPRSAGEEFAIAVAGPATSVVIALVMGIGAGLVMGHQEQVEALLSYLATINLLLAIFNILPGFPLDGGRVLRSIAWRRTGSFRKATRIAGGVGEMFGYLLMLGGVAFLLSGFLWNGLWFMFIGWFLLGAARGESQSMQLEAILGKLRARDVMHESYVSVSPGTAIQSVVDDYMLERGERAVIVAADGAVAGILTVTDIGRVPRAEWPSTPAQHLMTPREKVLTVGADAPALDVLMLVSQKRLNQVPVLEGGRMVGLITRRELLDRLHLAEELAPDLPEETQSPGA
jgi:Zn-dependent protease